MRPLYLNKGWHNLKATENCTRTAQKSFKNRLKIVLLGALLHVNSSFKTLFFESFYRRNQGVAVGVRYISDHADPSNCHIQNNTANKPSIVKQSQTLHCLQSSPCKKLFVGSETKSVRSEGAILTLVIAGSSQIHHTKEHNRTH